MARPSRFPIRLCGSINVDEPTAERFRALRKRMKIRTPHAMRRVIVAGLDAIEADDEQHADDE